MSVFSGSSPERARREWLEKEINILEDKSLWGELAERDKIWLDSYKTELREIIENEDKTTTIG